MGLVRIHLRDDMSQEQIIRLLTRPAQSAEDLLLEDHGLAPGEETCGPGTPLEDIHVADVPSVLAVADEAALVGLHEDVLVVTQPERGAGVGVEAVEA